MNLLDKLPEDLYGGWMFIKPFSPKPLAIGQIWRKCGPVGALKITRVMLPGHPEYNGGVHGLSVQATNIKNNSVSWNQSFFISGDQDTIHGYFKKLGYALAINEEI